MKENKKKVLCGDMIDCGKFGKKVKTSGTKGCLFHLKDRTNLLRTCQIDINYERLELY